MRAKSWSFALILTLAIGVSGYALWAYGGGVQRVPVHPDMIKVFNEHRVLITLHAVGASLGEVVDLNKPGQHLRLQQMKESLWTRFGYTSEYIRSMADQEFWEAEYAKIQEIDPVIAQVRGSLQAA